MVTFTEYLLRALPLLLGIVESALCVLIISILTTTIYSMYHYYTYLLCIWAVVTLTPIATEKSQRVENTKPKSLAFPSKIGAYDDT